MKKFFFVFILFLVAFSASAQFSYNISKPNAVDAFRTAVEAYGKGRYAEALLQFEKTLSSETGNPLVLYWLGKAYYKLGLNKTAFARWNEAISKLDNASFLQSRLELAGALTGPIDYSTATQYVRASDLSGINGKKILFARPSWVEPLPDDKTMIVSHGTNNILVINANGLILKVINGRTSGFDRPYACVMANDGTFYLSEFNSDRIAHISSDGEILGYIGDAEGLGRLCGPQYLCVDDDGFIYVSDVGFSRVVKFSPEGKAVLAFGKPSALFTGLSMPTGIAVLHDKIYVADNALKQIFIFDKYGNYIDTLNTGKLVRPEGLVVAKNGSLLLADTTRILSVNPSTGELSELFISERRDAKLVSAAFDVNGELIAADFDASELAWLSDPSMRFTGLFVEIQKIYSDAFPNVTIDFTVKDRKGNPITGLDFSNFYISEGQLKKERVIEGDKPVDYTKTFMAPANELKFNGSMDVAKAVELCFLYEGSPFMSKHKTEARDVAYSIYSAFEKDITARLVVAEKTPQPPSTAGIKAVTEKILNAQYSEVWRFDLGLKLAASSLFEAVNRKAVVYIGSGIIDDKLLKLSFTELSSLLKQNNIGFYAVIIGKNAPAEILTFLASETGGAVYMADRPSGLKDIAKAITNTHTGLYRVSYTSIADDAFGRRYIPINIEVYLRSRSGKDESGFFAPLR